MQLALFSEPQLHSPSSQLSVPQESVGGPRARRLCRSEVPAPDPQMKLPLDEFVKGNDSRVQHETPTDSPVRLSALEVQVSQFDRGTSGGSEDSLYPSKYLQEGMSLKVSPERDVARLRVSESELLEDIWSQLEEALSWEPDGFAADWQSGAVRSVTLVHPLSLPRIAQDYSKAMLLWGTGHGTGARWYWRPRASPTAGVCGSAEGIRETQGQMHDAQCLSQAASCWQLEVSFRLRSRAGAYCKSLRAVTLEPLRRDLTSFRTAFADLVYRHSCHRQFFPTAQDLESLRADTLVRSANMPAWMYMARDGFLAARVREMLSALGALTRPALRQVSLRPALPIIQLPVQDASLSTLLLVRARRA